MAHWTGPSSRAACLGIAVLCGLIGKMSYADPCSPASVDGFVNFTGRSYHKRKELAKSEARQDALQQVQERVCGGLSDDQCGVAVQYAHRLSEGQGPDAFCSTYQMRHKALNPKAMRDGAVKEKVEAAVEKLSIPNPGVSWRPTRDEDGCAVGRFGAVAEEVLQSRFPGTFETASSTIGMTVQVAASGASGVVEYVDDSGSVQRSATFDLSEYRQFMAWSPGESRCGLRTAKADWLTQARQTDDGTVLLSRSSGLCSGDVVSMRVRPPPGSGHLRLATVEADGSVYSMFVQDLYKIGEIDLGEFAVFSGDQMSTAMVVALFMEGPSDPALDVPCILQPTSLERYGASAIKVAGKVYSVSADGEDSCSLTGEAADRSQQLKELKGSLQACSW